MHSSSFHTLEYMPRSGRYGFTLIEVMLVAALLVVLLAAVVPKLQQTAQRLRAEGAAFELAHVLRYAHGRAVAQGDVLVASWDVEAHRLRLRAVDGRDPQSWPRQCPVDAVPVAPSADSAIIPASIAVTLARQDQPASCVMFFPDGTSQPTTVHVTHHGRDYAIAIDPSTSDVQLSTEHSRRGFSSISR